MESNIATGYFIGWEILSNLQDTKHLVQNLKEFRCQKLRLAPST